MKKRFSLALLFGLLLALVAEAILAPFKALQGGRIRFRWMCRSWIALPPPAAHTAPLLAQRTNTAVRATPAARPAKGPSHSPRAAMLVHTRPEAIGIP